MPNTAVRRQPFRKRGQLPFFLSSLSLGTETGSGGVEIGGSADVLFTHGPQVPSDIVVEWDLDNDGDFASTEEDITSFVLSLETVTGRDWPSLLTGKAGPGQLRATLRNDDDRFNYFNAASPLTQAPFSLLTGRRVRVRMASATTPDPALLAKDRFGRANGALGTPEVGAAWSGPLTDDFTIVSMRARPATEGQPHIAVLDAGATDYYMQARWSEVGSTTNVVGLVYRYQDTSNYSLAVVDVSAGQLQLRNVVAGVPTTIEAEAIEIYDELTLGVLVESTSVTLYHEGVAVMVDTAVQTDETEVGLYASWGTGDVRPAADDFYVWDGVTAEIEGVIWTGDLSDLSVSVEAGPEKYAMIEAEGRLSVFATQTLQPTRSVAGKKTGIFVGNLLARANLLHPPGPIDEGDVTTGAVGLDDGDGLEGARTFEEVEYGFLYETPEGPIGFASRTARDGTIPEATFGDSLAAPYRYTAIAPLNWRREVFNRVVAGVSPLPPSGVTASAYTQAVITGIPGTLDEEGDPVGAYVPFDVDLPATVAAGDLLLVVAGAVGYGGGLGYEDTWVTPAGWQQVYLGTNGTDPDVAALNQVFARVADGTEGGTSVVLFTTKAPGLGASHRSGAAHVFRVTSWFGSLESGLSVADLTAGSDPSVVFPSWGPAPSLVIAARSGFLVGLGSPTVSGTTYPRGYSSGTSSTASNTSTVTIQTAYRTCAVEVENPAAFGGTFSGFTATQTLVIAVRGFNGSPPDDSGQVTVQVDDLDSQAEHNSIRSYPDAPAIFATEADAETYGELVLARHAGARPIFQMSFVATKSGAYRGQAYRRRVGDRITLLANGNSGLGVSQEFFIENISHRWRAGVTFWETTWELSPA